MSATILLSTDAFSCESNFDVDDIRQVIAVGEQTLVNRVNLFQQLSPFEEKTIKVFVSCFAESWITAVCLYSRPGIIVQLYVLPYLHRCPGVITIELLRQQQTVFAAFMKVYESIKGKMDIRLSTDVIQRHLNKNNICYEKDIPLHWLISNMISKIDLNFPSIDQVEAEKNLPSKTTFAIYRIVYQNKTVSWLRTIQGKIILTISYTVSAEDDLIHGSNANKKNKTLEFLDFNGIQFDEGMVVHKGLPNSARKPGGICGLTPQQRSWWQSAATSAATPAAATKRSWGKWFGFGGRSRRKSHRKRQKRSRFARKSRR